MIDREEFDILTQRIAQQEAEIETLEKEVSELERQMVTFRQRYDRIVGPLIVQLEAARGTVNQLEDLLQRRQWGERVTIDALLSRSAEARATSSVRDRTFYSEPEPQAGPATRSEQSALLKALYRRLARRFHPDLAVDAQDREDRNRLMGVINQAYREGDLDLLSKLDSPAEQSRQYAAQAATRLLIRMELDNLRRRSSMLAQRIDDLLAIRSDLMYGEMADLKLQVAMARARGQDLLQQIADDLRREYNETMQRVDQLRRQLD